MKSLLSKLIHLIIMPCSYIPTLIEQKTAGMLPLGKRIRLKMHLYICKWCSAYEKKMKWIDHSLASKIKKHNPFDSKEIRAIKDKIKEKIFQ